MEESSKTAAARRLMEPTHRHPTYISVDYST